MQILFFFLNHKNLVFLHLTPGICKDILGYFNMFFQEKENKAVRKASCFEHLKYLQWSHLDEITHFVCSGVGVKTSTNGY